MWTGSYQDLAGTDAGAIPLLGVRVLLGVDDEGKDTFTMSINGDNRSTADEIKAVFMLDMARRRRRSVGRGSGPARRCRFKAANPSPAHPASRGDDRMGDVQTPKHAVSRSDERERVTGIEPAFSAWETDLGVSLTCAIR